MAEHFLTNPSNDNQGNTPGDAGQALSESCQEKTGDAATATSQSKLLRKAQADNVVVAASNPFDPAAFRLSQDFASTINVRRVLTAMLCRKPHRHEFVRVRPGEEWRFETSVFEDKVNREVFIVARDLWPELVGEVYRVCLFLTINRQEDIFLWPVKLPGPDGRSNQWNDSALAAARMAESKWVRVAANMSGGMYDVFEAAGKLSEPTWPELSEFEILNLCFKDRRIQSVDHPAIRAIRGLI